MCAEEPFVGDFRGRVDDMSCQGDQASKSMGLIEPERLVLNQLPSDPIHRVYDTDGPGPHDYEFSRVKTLKFFEAPDGSDDLCGCVKKLWPRVGCHG